MLLARSSEGPHNASTTFYLPATRQVKSSQVKFLLSTQIQNSPPLVPGAGSSRRRQNLNLELEALQNSDFESRVHRRGFLLRLAVAIHHTPPPLDTTTTTLPHFSRVISGYTTHRPSSSSPPWVVIVVVGGCGVVGCGVAGSMSGRSGGSCGGGWDAAMLLFCCWFSTSAFAPTAPAAAAAPSNPAGLPPGPLPPGREFAMCAAP